METKRKVQLLSGILLLLLLLIIVVGVVIFLVPGSNKAAQNKPADTAQPVQPDFDIQQYLAKLKDLNSKANNGKITEQESEQLYELMLSFPWMRSSIQPAQMEDVCRLSLLPLEQSGNYMVLRSVLDYCRKNDINVESHLRTRFNKLRMSGRNGVFSAERIIDEKMLAGNYPETLQLAAVERVTEMTAAGRLDTEYLDTVYRNFRTAVKNKETADKIAEMHIDQLLDFNKVELAQDMVRELKTAGCQLKPETVLRYSKYLFSKGKNAEAMQELKELRKKYPDSEYSEQANTLSKKYLKRMINL